MRMIFVARLKYQFLWLMSLSRFMNRPRPRIPLRPPGVVGGVSVYRRKFPRGHHVQHGGSFSEHCVNIRFIVVKKDER